MSFEVESVDRRATNSGWSIKVAATMPSKGITMEMRPGVVVGKLMADEAGRMLSSIGIVYHSDSTQSRVNVQEASGRCALCGLWGHIGLDCDKLKPQSTGRCSIDPQAGDKLYQSKINLKNVLNVATPYKAQEGSFFDPGAHLNFHMGGTGI
jgi:hypothetical protein